MLETEILSGLKRDEAVVQTFRRLKLLQQRIHRRDNENRLAGQDLSHDGQPLRIDCERMGVGKIVVNLFERIIDDILIRKS